MSESSDRKIRIGVLTSGGDAQGMNAAVRAIVRAGLHAGAEVYAIREGWQGAVDGSGIVPMSWDDVGSILHRGGTVIGTARCDEFRERSGLRKAARNLVQHGIDRLIVIGGDGSLAGANEFRQEWPGLLDELVEAGELTTDQVEEHRSLFIAGLIGSIDNDMVGTDMTIGTDSALHRITEAIDAISSTAASHQRSFVVEVMGRRCGYLALTAALAGGADYALIPERPPADGWEDQMSEMLRRGRAAGRRDSIIVVAEGAKDRHGEPITSQRVKDALRERLGEDARITILGHVQRGGTPSAYDRWMATMLGVAAVDEVLAAKSDSAPQVLGVRSNRVQRMDLMDAVAATRRVADRVKAGDYEQAMEGRSASFGELVRIMDEITEAQPSAQDLERGRRIGIMHAGGLAPGMNSAAKAAVRLGLNRGHTMLAIRGGFPGLADDRVEPVTWGEVEGWEGTGGAELGTRREVPVDEQLYLIGRAIERHEIDGLLVIGGFSAYEAVHRLWESRKLYPAFNIPIVTLPASIDNNLPGASMSVGADTALNMDVMLIDRLKQSAIASQRCFVVETMGRYCGFLALASGVAAGAERVYLNEVPFSIADLERDVAAMRESFAKGRRFYLAVRNEEANEYYTTDFLRRLFEAEGGENFDVRQAILGHVQQGGTPSPFDRVAAIRYAAKGLDELDRQFAAGAHEACFAAEGPEGLRHYVSFKAMDDMVDWPKRRPVEQWWMQLLPIMSKLSNRPEE
ncbi:6-phosphofructokinase [Enemella sp. A6]|uniref:6-phosphofructokinase n=1 Tax=Enemella sp. A6 TaxID=3440152 RepID=UPI003EC0EB1C